MKTTLPIWRKSDGAIVSCVEKIKVMQENLEELQQALQDAFEDGILMEINPEQIKQFLVSLINNLEDPYKEYKDNNV